MWPFFYIYTIKLTRNGASFVSKFTCGKHNYFTILNTKFRYERVKVMLILVLCKIR